MTIMQNDKQIKNSMAKFEHTQTVSTPSQNELLDRFGDREETIYSAELFLLRRIAETSSDMVKARDWPEFRGASGGQEKLNKAHADALNEYEQWLADGEG